MLDDLLDEGGAALLTRLREQYTASHRCARCSGPIEQSGSDERDKGFPVLSPAMTPIPTAMPFCPHCGVLVELHADGCPDETEARERWGR